MILTIKRLVESSSLLAPALPRGEDARVELVAHTGGLMSNRSVIAVCMLALSLAGCAKKEDLAAADAAPSATSVATVAPAASTSAEPDKAGEPATAAAPAEKAGNKDVPATPKAASADADGTPTAAADAGTTAVETCCCDVPGEPLAQVGQSECTKSKKGQCVKKDRCAAVPAAVDAGPAVQQCCCDSAGTKKLRGQSECTKGGAGKCVKMAECK